MSLIKWLPMESNPSCLINLGVPDKWGLTDIITLEEECMHMISTPCLALLLLFPITPKYIEYCEEQEAILKKKKEKPDDVYFMKQTIANACGTIAMIHAVANNESHLDIQPDSVLKKFLASTKDLSPEEKGKVLEENMDISAVHDASAQEGQTEAPNVDDEINLHYIAIVNVGGKLVELDGRKSGPIIHGDTNDDSFLKDGLRLCQDYMERDPDNLNFNALAFGAM